MTWNHQGRSTSQHMASSALSLGHLIENCLRILNYWSERARSRQALGELDERLLRDVGLTLAQAQRESSMAFWQPLKKGRTP
jgi:uncharacterized protein YjiS (DUF1127 family)